MKYMGMNASATAIGSVTMARSAPPISSRKTRTTMAARASVPLDHPNYVPGFGRGGDAAKQEADVVHVAGSRLGNLDLPFDKYWGDPRRQQLIQIDIDPRNMGAHARCTSSRVGAIERKVMLRVATAWLNRSRTLETTSATPNKPIATATRLTPSASSK